MSALSVLLFIIVSVSFVSSLLFWQPPSKLKELLNTNQKSPFNQKNHQSLSKLYSQLHQNSKAQKEMQLATQFKGMHEKTAVLGQQESNTTHQQKFADQIHYWQTITATYPTYKDGWLQLLFLAQITQNEELFIQSKEELIKIAPEYIQNPPDFFNNF